MKALIQRLKSNDIFKAVASLFGANMFASLVGIVGSLLQGRFITAEELGFIKQFSIINSYLFIFQFGIFHAVERLYPWHMAHHTLQSMVTGRLRPCPAERYVDKQ